MGKLPAITSTNTADTGATTAYTSAAVIGAISVSVNTAVTGVASTSTVMTEALPTQEAQGAEGGQGVTLFVSIAT